MADETLIEQALAAADRIQIEPGQSALDWRAKLKLSPEQALVFAIYHTAKSRERGWLADAEVDQAARAAQRHGIARHQIDAAIAAAADR